MIRGTQLPSPIFAEPNSGDALRAQQIGTIPAMPVVISRRFKGVAGRTKAVWTPHWLSACVTPPGGAPARKAFSPTGDRATIPIVTWASCLPPNCIERMILHDGDHPTVIPDTSVVRFELKC